MAAFSVGARAEQSLTLDAEAIRAGALLVGDHNRVHHDEEFAKTTRFGGLIASGAHMAGLLAGLISQGWGPPSDEPGAGGYVGVDYTVKWLRPVRANRRLIVEWVVTAIEQKRSRHVVRLEGKIVDTVEDRAVVTGRMTILSFV